MTSERDHRAAAALQHCVRAKSKAVRAAARGRPPLQLLYSFSNLLYGWSVSPIRPAHTTWRQNENKVTLGQILLHIFQRCFGGSISPRTNWEIHPRYSVHADVSLNLNAVRQHVLLNRHQQVFHTRSMELFISMGNENNCPPYQFCNSSYGLLLTAYYCVCVTRLERPRHWQTSLLMSVVALNRFSPPYLCRLEGCLYFVL